MVAVVVTVTLLGIVLSEIVVHLVSNPYFVNYMIKSTISINKVIKISVYFLLSSVLAFFSFLGIQKSQHTYTNNIPLLINTANAQVYCAVPTPATGDAEPVCVMHRGSCGGDGDCG